MTPLKVIVEKQPDGYIAYPPGMKTIVVGWGNTCEEALKDIQAVIRLHMRLKRNDEGHSTRAPLVRMRKVSKFYPLGENRIAALRGVDFSMEQGELVGVWGPEGSGKTTLCNLIGMIDSPCEGVLEFSGREMLHLSDAQKSTLRNLSIGYIFRDYNLIPVISALENVMLPLQVLGAPIASARAKALERLAEVGLSDHMSLSPNKLSGEERQRVAIARALVTDPVLIIADEPTANLDPENSAKIIDLMCEINRTRGTSFLFSTHDQRFLDRVRRRVHLHDGSIVEDRRVV